MQNDFTVEQLFVELYVYERPLSSYFRYSFEKFFHLIFISPKESPVMKERHFKQGCSVAVLILNRKHFRRLIIRAYKLKFLYFVKLLTRIKVHMIDLRTFIQSKRFLLRFLTKNK